MASINEVTISGYLADKPEIKEIPNSTGDPLQVCNGTLTYIEARGDKNVEQWIDIEAWRGKAFELADMPTNTEVTVKGSVTRRAWPSKKHEGEWVVRHRVKVREIVQSAADPDPQAVVTESAPPPTDADLPF